MKNILSVILTCSMHHLFSQISLLSPNGGEVWQAGTLQHITWTCPAGDSATVMFSNDNGITYNIIALNVGDTSFSWTVPNISSTQCMMSVFSLTAGMDYCDASFTISNPSGIKNNSQNEKLIVTNNRAEEKLIISNTNETICSVELISLTGQVIFSTTYSQNNRTATISTATIVAGIYTIRASTNNNIITQKININK